MAAKVIAKSTKKKSNTANAAVSVETGRWNGHKFLISQKLIRGFSGLQIKGACELKDKSDSEQGYVAKKGGSPIEVTLTIHLSAFTGCDVRAEAILLVREARAGKRDYFYVGNKKLISSRLMLTAANVSNVEISHKGTWTSADVALTMKQCMKTDTVAKSATTSSNSGSSSSSGTSSGSGSGKASVKTTSPTTTKTYPKNTVSGGVAKAASVVSTVSKKQTTATKKAQVRKAVAKTRTIIKANKVYTSAKKGGGGGTRRFLQTK